MLIFGGVCLGMPVATRMVAHVQIADWSPKHASCYPDDDRFYPMRGSITIFLMVRVDDYNINT